MSKKKIHIVIIDNRKDAMRKIISKACGLNTQVPKMHNLPKPPKIKSKV